MCQGPLSAEPSSPKSSIYLFYVPGCFACKSVGLSFVCSNYRGQKRASEPLNLELQMAVSHHPHFFYRLRDLRFSWLCNKYFMEGAICPVVAPLSLSIPVVGLYKETLQTKCGCPHLQIQALRSWKQEDAGCLNTYRESIFFLKRKEGSGRERQGYASP